MIDILFYTGIVLILIFSYSNGMKDGSNVAATVISSSSLSYRKSIFILILAELAGPFLLGTHVAATVAKHIININNLFQNDVNSMLLIVSGLAGAIIWNLLTYYFSLPTSSSFALIGGMIGPVIFVFKKTAIPWHIFKYKVIGALFLSPIIGIIFGYYIYKFFTIYFANSHYKIINKIKKSQILTLIFLGINHGTNDSQKAMGIIILLLFISGKANNLNNIPLWVKFISISTLVIGIKMSGENIIKTVGYKIFKVRPLHSLSSHISAVSILMVSNIFGAPVSTTQIVSSSVIGVGSSFRKKSVKWQIFINILWSWILTIPLAGLISILVYVILKKIIIG